MVPNQGTPCHLQKSPAERHARGQEVERDCEQLRRPELSSPLTLRREYQLNAPAFVKLFGPAKPGGKSGKQRSSVFGFEDELKVAPKIEGVDKSHPQIAWLKLKSFIVSTE